MHRQSSYTAALKGKSFGLGLLLLLLVACGGNDTANDGDKTNEQTMVEQFMLDTAAVERGQALYIGSCATFCHAEMETGEEVINLFDCDWKHGGSDDEIFNVVTNGVPDTRMVGFGTNFPEGESDLLKIIAYLRTNQQPCS